MPAWSRWGAVVLTGWAALAVAGWWYAGLKSIPTWAAVPIVAAFLLEFSLYLVPGAEAVRMRLEALPRRSLGAAMTVSGVAPYAAYSVGTGLFAWPDFLAVGGIAGAVSFWYVALRRSPWVDLAFAAGLAAIVLGKALDPLYPSPVAQVRDLDILGKLMLIRLAALAVLSIRHMKGVGFGFIPRRREWWIGLRQYGLFLLIGLPVALLLGVMRWAPEVFAPGKVALTFFAILWVVALSEEFFFRGLLLQWLRDWTGSSTAALLLTSAIFGLAHLPFRYFPNWRFALVAAVAGWFYGRAYQQAGSIRAAMVTHSLVVTTWRAAFL